MKIEHDFHIHTNLSVCADRGATLEGYVQNAKVLGLKKLGISNHFWDAKIEGASKFYASQDYAHVALIQPEIEKYNREGIEIYYGCEAEYDPVHHGVAVTEEQAEAFAYMLVPNSHTHATMPKDCYQPYQKHVDFMIRAYEEIIDSKVSRFITAIAHPFEAVCCPYDYALLIDLISDDTFKRLFDRTAEKEIAIEINVWSMREKSREEIEQDRKTRIFRLAKECGCKFIFGSDAHKHAEHDRYDKAADLIAEVLALEESDLAPIVRG